MTEKQDGGAGREARRLPTWHESERRECPSTQRRRVPTLKAFRAGDYLAGPDFSCGVGKAVQSRPRLRCTESRTLDRDSSVDPCSCQRRPH